MRALPFVLPFPKTAIFLFGVLGFFAAVPAFAGCEPDAATATVCAWKSCDTQGETKMDGDKKNVVACLKDDTANVSGGHTLWTPVNARGPLVADDSACPALGAVAHNASGRLLSCQNGRWQQQLKITEESGFIVGCHTANDYCKNLNGAPPSTTLYRTHGGNAWDATIGPRTFCALGFVSTGTGASPATGEQSGTFCRVVPGDADAATGLPVWHIRTGSTGDHTIACHAVCIQ